MNILLIIFCLILSGCQSAPKISDRDLLLIATMQSLQTSMNVQAMEKSHDELMEDLEVKEVKKENKMTEEVFIIQQKLRESISKLRIKYYYSPEALQALLDVEIKLYEI